MVLRPHLSNFAFFGALAPPLIRPEGILRELALVLGERGLGLCMPDPTLVIRKVLPCEADDFGEGAVVCFDLGRNVLALDERRAEQDEGIGRARDVILRLLLAVGRSARGGTIIGRGEEDIFGKGRINEGRGTLIKSHGV
jgi:hypothetical protein